jgi:glycosyltransferase involved in cell wall biosynthesis
LSIDLAQFDHSLRATALVGTYVPRACGIATFTRDLREALVFDAAAAPSAGPGPPWVVALDHGRGRDPVAYPPEVRHRLRRGDRGSVNRIATALEADGVRVVSLQHEFGIYGGHSGRDVLALADALRAPLVTTFHTVLARPQPLQREIVRRLAAASARVVVMTERGRALLQSAHGVPAERITVIPHGVPDMPFADPDVAKPPLGVGGRRVILSFGLINPNKALELAIDALARVVGEVPEACYVICGATHPDVRRRHGEAYRHSLVERIEHLGLEKHVRFVDRYLDQRELTAWLQAADVFVTPYANAAQITSGTLAYAVAAGKAVVSTPYEHARELLADGRGAVVPFGDVEALAARFRELLTDDAARDAMRRLAWQHGRASIWPAVGQRYRELFVEVIAERRAAERAAAPPMAAVAVAPRSPDGRRPLPRLPFPAPLAGVSRRHLDRMWDEWGLFQHAIGAHPDPRHGFCTDDVARAIVVDLLQSLATSWPAPAASLRRGVAFLEAAFHPEEGRFRNFRGADGRWLEAVGSEDSHGRALQALGAVIRGSHDPILHARVRRLFTVALPAALSFRSLRPWAYAILGCDATLAAGASAGIPDATAAPATRLTLATLAGRLAAAVASAPERHGWPWPEHAVTYDNGVVPQALIAAGLRLERDDWVRLGLDRLAWLAAAQTAPDGHLTLIGNDGWWPRGDRPARFDQQPIEAVSLLEAARMALAGTGEPHWALLMERAYSWFLGANDLGLPLADPDHGSCRDGLRPDSINPNRGAESTLAWLLAVERIRGLRSPVGLLIGTPRSEVALSGSG